MKPAGRGTWQEIRGIMLDRILNQQWKPGEPIPNEVKLAEEFGSARATVNRALQSLADHGWIDRKRKAGSRVKPVPERKATFRIPVIREEILSSGDTYDYKLLKRAQVPAPASVTNALNLGDRRDVLHLQALHFCDDKPYVIEKRWINLSTVSKALAADFAKISANEWLIANAPYTRAEFTFSAVGSDATSSKHLKIEPGTPVFQFERSTWDAENSITLAVLTFAPGYKLTTVSDIFG